MRRPKGAGVNRPNGEASKNPCLGEPFHAYFGPPGSNTEPPGVFQSIWATPDPRNSRGLTSGFPLVRDGRLAAGHILVQRIRRTGRQAIRDIASDLCDLSYDFSAGRAGRSFEQISNRRTDFCLGIFLAVKIHPNSCDLIKPPISDF
jgi:hypothetical protein